MIAKQKLFEVMTYEHRSLICEQLRMLGRVSKNNLTCRAVKPHSLQGDFMLRLHIWAKKNLIAWLALLLISLEPLQSFMRLCILKTGLLTTKYVDF